jgi:Ca-activated chloride channel family protein
MKTKRLGFATLLCLCSAFVMGISNAAMASGLLIADGGFGGRLEIKEQDVKVTINNGIAVTEINQVFLNKENRIVEALYTFPVPKGASVSNFSMIINGKEMIGEVVEKKRARQIYESYKSKRVDPGLLEQVDYKRFEMRVFPIAANAEQHIKVTYYQKLDFDHDWATYVYPLATSTQSTNEKTTGKFALTLDVNSEIPITQIKSPSHDGDFVVSNHTDNYLRASLETTEGDLSKDVVLSIQTKRPRTGLDMIASRQEGEDGFYMMTLTAGEELEDEVGGMDYVFVVDISGSMQNRGKLELSTKAADAFISSLGPEDRCEVMSFNTVPTLLFEELSPVHSETKAATKEFLNTQSARGGTNLRPALLAATKYKDPDRPLNIVVLSDGMTEQREQRELLSTMNAAPDGIRVFCIGVGNDVNRPLLNQVASEAGGLAAFISQGDDFDRQAESFRRKLVHPVMTDLRLEVEGVESYDTLPSALPNLYHGSPIQVLGRYKRSGEGTVRISGNLQGRPFEKEVQMEFPEADSDNPQIERMWAYQNVQTLMDQIRKTGETVMLRNEIVELCENFSIVSEYASFIVLENDGEYQRWKIDRKNASRIERDRDARKRLEKRLEELREASMANIGPREPSKVEKKESAQVASKRPRKSNRSQPVSTRPVSTRPASNRSFDFDVSTNRRSSSSSSSGGGGGGGAIDPITGMICLGFGGAAALRRRRKKQASKE